jgi:hypothetical protein
MGSWALGPRALGLKGSRSHGLSVSWALGLMTLRLKAETETGELEHSKVCSLGDFGLLRFYLFESQIPIERHPPLQLLAPPSRISRKMYKNEATHCDNCIRALRLEKCAQV